MLDSTFYEADNQGRIFIPYGREHSANVVLIHNNFADLAYFT